MGPSFDGAAWPKVVRASICSQPPLKLATCGAVSTVPPGRWEPCASGAAMLAIAMAWGRVHAVRGQRRPAQKRFKAAVALKAMPTKSMSPITAQLVATDILEEVQDTMQATPATWVSGIEEVDTVRRHGQTLRYLHTCYSNVSQVLPSLDADKLAHVQSLLERLQSLSDSGVKEIEERLGEPENTSPSVPKFYYSELRHRQKCTLPQPPAQLSEGSLLSYLIVEAVARMRNRERFEKLAKERCQVVSCDTWAALGKSAGTACIQLIAGAVIVFGEGRVKAALEECLRTEQAVCHMMLDSSSGPSSGSAISQDALGEMDDDDDEDDDDDGDYCSIFAKPVLIVSDCTGESAERTVSSALGQFGHCFDRSYPADITTYRFVNVGMLHDIVLTAQKRGALIVFTLVEPNTNQAMAKLCEDYGVEYHDLWTPLLNKLEGYFETTSLGVPGRKQGVDEKYMKLIECIEYTRQLDDGVQPKKWKGADLMIIGPSRSGKTPLAFFMAQRGFKVANYPIVPDEPIPDELWQLDQGRIFALTIEPQKLSKIRNTRMETLQMGARSSYAKLGKVQEELDWCRNLYRKNPQWTVLDTSDSGIEENCARIMMMLEERGGVRSRVDNTDSPSAI